MDIPRPDIAKKKKARRIIYNLPKHRASSNCILVHGATIHAGRRGLKSRERDGNDQHRQKPGSCPFFD